MSDLPPGFVRDKAPATDTGLPPGFVLDKPPPSSAGDGSHTAEYLPVRKTGAGGLEWAIPRIISDAFDQMAKGGKAAMGRGPMPNPQEMVSLAAIGSPASVARGTGRLIAGEAAAGRYDKIIGDEIEKAMPAKPMLALPPPTMGVAGQPATSTADLGRAAQAAGRNFPVSPWRESLEPRPMLGPPAGARVTGQSEPGMLPPGPTSTMTKPSATPPPTTPPRLTVEMPSSGLANAIASGNPGAVDRTLTGAYRGVIAPAKPIGGRKLSAPVLDQQDRQIVTAVDRIIENRPNLKLTTEAGQEVRGQLPQSRRQFSEAIDQTKRGIYSAYNQLATEAGGAGARVDAKSAAEALRAEAAKPALRDVHPNLAAEAEQMAQNFEKAGSYSPEQAQDLIQSLNSSLAGAWFNRTIYTESQASLYAAASKALLKQLDDTIAKAGGSQYRELRNQYGALRSIENDVANAAAKEAKNIPGGLLSEVAKYGMLEQFMHGAITANPAAIGRGVTMGAALAVRNWLRSPNRAVTRLFERRAANQQGIRLAHPPSRLTSPVMRAAAAETMPRRRQSQDDIAPPPGPR